jgi:hypothetical protein
MDKDKDHNMDKDKDIINQLYDYLVSFDTGFSIFNTGLDEDGAYFIVDFATIEVKIHVSNGNWIVLQLFFKHEKRTCSFLMPEYNNDSSDQVIQCLFSICN